MRGKSRYFVLLLAILLLISGCSLFGKKNGNVTVALILNDGTPLSGIDLTLTNGKDVFKGKTNSSGKALYELPAGNYTVEGALPLFDGTKVAISKKITVKSGDNPEVVHKVSNLGKILVSVIDTTEGNPVSDATLTVSYDTNQKEVDLGDTGKTQLLAKIGTYTLTVGKGNATSEPCDVVLESKKQEVEIKLDVTPTYEKTVSLKLADNSPVTDVELTLKNDKESVKRTTNKDGKAIFLVEAGTYTLEGAIALIDGSTEKIFKEIEIVAGNNPELTETLNTIGKVEVIVIERGSGEPVAGSKLLVSWATEQKELSLDPTGKTHFYAKEETYILKAVKDEFVSETVTVVLENNKQTSTLKIDLSKVLLYEANFDETDPAAVDWTPIAGTWTILDGKMVNSDIYHNNTSIYQELEQVGDGTFIYEYKFKPIDKTKDFTPAVGIHFMASDGEQASARGTSYLIFQEAAVLQIYRAKDGVLGGAIVKEPNFGCALDEDFITRIEYNNVTGVISVFVNGEKAAEWTDPSPIKEGNYLSLRTNCTAAEYDYIKVWFKAN